MAASSLVPLPDYTRNVYIVYMYDDMKPKPFTLREHWYASLLREVSGFQTGTPELLYTYNTGFAATLSPAEAEALKTMSCVFGVCRSSPVQLDTTHSPDCPSSPVQFDTTHSPDFLHLTASSNAPTNDLLSCSNYGKDVFAAVVDSEISPESRSFQDEDLGPQGSSSPNKGTVVKEAGGKGTDLLATNVEWPENQNLH